jgi:very-short-patch-repair endonuclease
MSQTPFDKIAAFVRNAALSDLQLLHDRIDAESPIERLLITAVHAVAKYEGHCFYEGLQICSVPGDGSLNVFSDYTLFCVPQMPEGPYRIDFAFFMSDGADVRKLAVECDGHEFHERTKDQAERDRSRDRALQERGYTIYRFTGREIYRDPMKCARQIAAWADDVSYGGMGK